MKLQLKRPTTMLGKASLLLIIFTVVAWLFVTNAQNCLSRDFVFPPYPPAICWRATNDYESAIMFAGKILLILLVLTIACSSAALTKLRIKRSPATPAEHKKTVWFLAATSILILIFVVTMFEVWQRTTHNNNNYFLNSATNVVLDVGAPLWLAITTAAITYKLVSSRSRGS